MRMNQYLLSCAAMIGLGAMFAPMEAMSADFPPGCVIAGSTAACNCSDAPNSVSPPCTCKSPSYTAVLTNRQTTSETSGLQTAYTYTITGTSAKINSISEGQMVIPRPLTPVAPSASSPDIITSIGGVTTGNYCEADKNSGVNKGNCDGFVAHIPPSGISGGTALFKITSGQRVADGLVTLNFVGGNGSTEICLGTQASGLPPIGMVGPGEIGDPFQPKFTNQVATVAGGKCTAHLVFDKRGNVIDVTTDPPCVVGSPTGDIIVNGKPLKNNTGPHGLTFGDGTSTCYGPSIPSPPRCVCTALPCP